MSSISSYNLPIRFASSQMPAPRVNPFSVYPPVLLGRSVFTASSPMLLNKVFDAVGHCFPDFLSIDDHSHLQLTSLAGKRIIDADSSYRYALPFKKFIEAIETQPMQDQVRREARKHIVEQFFKSPHISRLHPIPLTVLFDSLSPKILKDPFFWKERASKIIEKIAVHFFSSQSTAKGLEGIVQIYGPTAIEKWDAINKQPGDFFVKLCPIPISTMIPYVLKAAKQPIEVGRLDHMVFWAWLMKQHPLPDTLRPMNDYFVHFMQKKGVDFFRRYSLKSTVTTRSPELLTKVFYAVFHSFPHF